jgi:hypothetical protein
MGTVSFRKDPKYNGTHQCPKCGNKSEWLATGKEADTMMIGVRCAGRCKAYVMPLAQLSEYPDFKDSLPAV